MSPEAQPEPSLGVMASNVNDDTELSIPSYAAKAAPGYRSWASSFRTAGVHADAG